MFKFDLQLFDEDVEPAEVNSTAESSTETEKVNLPEGFEGLEEYKEEILSEAAQMQKSEISTEKDLAEQKIPYGRFKSVIDERNALKAQIDELKKQGVQIAEPPPAQPKPAAPVQRPQQDFQMPQLQVTPEFMTAVNSATKNLAMQMANFTPEQVQQIEEYGEEGDADFERWQYAKQLANQSVYSEIQRVRAQQAQQAQTFLNEHSATVQSYNEFAQREMSAPEFKEVVNYATGEYFDSLPETAQRIIANSYVQIERRERKRCKSNERVRFGKID